MRAGRLVLIAAVLGAAAMAAPAAQAGLTCMPRPSACGFPDATNTGVPPGTHLTVVNGPVTLSTPGMTYSGYEVHGDVIVAANNVTIANVRVISGGWRPINLVQNHVSGTRIHDVEINMHGQQEGVALGFDNFVATRVWIHNGLDCAYAGHNVVITNSFCDLPRLSSGSSAHADGFQSGGGSNFVFSHNTIRNPNGQTSAILMSTNTGAIDNVVIDNNLMSGGGGPCTAGPTRAGWRPTRATPTTSSPASSSRKAAITGRRTGATAWTSSTGTCGTGTMCPRPAAPAPRPLRRRPSAPVVAGVAPRSRSRRRGGSRSGRSGASSRAVAAIAPAGCASSAIASPDDASGAGSGDAPCAGTASCIATRARSPFASSRGASRATG
jgi:hypothetical protein